jgi:hypothetical protein
MIKKIYDRDTGNIYDVGADNKLKLVDRIVIENEADSSTCVNFTLTNQLEIGKTYLLKLIDDAASSNHYNTFIHISSEETYNYCIGLARDYDSDGDVTVRYYYHTTPNIAISIEGINEINLYNNYEILEIYELPFSM